MDFLFESFNKTSEKLKRRKKTDSSIQPNLLNSDFGWVLIFEEKENVKKKMYCYHFLFWRLS